MYRDNRIEVDKNGTVAITGTPTQNQTLTATLSDILIEGQGGTTGENGANTAGLTYEWHRGVAGFTPGATNGASHIQGVTGNTYQLTQADVGMHIRALVRSYTGAGGNGSESNHFAIKPRQWRM